MKRVLIAMLFLASACSSDPAATSLPANAHDVVQCTSGQCERICADPTMLRKSDQGCETDAPWAGSGISACASSVYYGELQGCCAYDPDDGVQRWLDCIGPWPK